MKLFLKLFSLSIFLLGNTFTCVCQFTTIDVLGSYYHNETMMEFPEFFNGMTRENITSFSADSSNIGVSYHLISMSKNVWVTVYVYRAPIATEKRIREEFLNCIHSIRNIDDLEINPKPEHVKVSKNGYKVLGLSAAFSNDYESTVLVLFECGKYFLKYRISSDNADTVHLNKISKKFIDKFSPIDIVKKHSLNHKIYIDISPAVKGDSSTFAAILSAANAKSKWVVENIDSLEMCSGFPSLYFEEQKFSINEMLNKWESLRHSNFVFDNYLNELLKIRKSGFLNEFICDQYWRTLLIPENIKLDWVNYEKWKSINKPSVKLVDQYLYLIGYENSSKDPK